MRSAGMPALDPRPATFQFASNSSYRKLDAKQAPQAGDVIVVGGHAGVLTGSKHSDGTLMAYDCASIRSLTQEDPIGLAGGLNLYGFANGDPVNFSDPFGLCPPELTRASLSASSQRQALLARLI